MNELQLWQLVMYGGFVLLVVGAMLGLAFGLGERRRLSRAARQPYESGLLPIHTMQIRIPVQFYLVGMLFVIFDLEAVFIFAWAIVVREAGWPGFWAMTLFLIILFVGLIYEWRVGALNWGPDFDRIRERMEKSRRITPTD
jgi:NADH-quinone oxidoreductase subunit A